MNRCCTLLFLPVCALIVLGCNNTTEFRDESASTENQIVAILAPLTEERPTLVTYRSMLQNLNGYFDSLGETYRKEITFSPEQSAVIDLLLAQVSRGEKARRQDDVKNKTFNLLGDSSHLDASLLFRDAAQTLVQDIGDAPPASETAALEKHQLDVARHIFAWTMRQVALDSSTPESPQRLPAHEVLRRGSGDAQDRLRVFLELLQQTDLPGCAVLIKQSQKEDTITVTRSVPLLGGVLIGKSIYVFDPVSGNPVLASDGVTVAKLEQLREQPGQFQTWTKSRGVSDAQLKEAAAVLLVNFTAMAPRMKVLQRELDQQQNRVRLFDPVPDRMQKFKAAGITINPWTSEVRPGEPALTLLHFLENPQSDPKANYLASRRQKLVPAWALEMEKQIGLTGTPQSLLYEFDRRFLAVRYEPGGGRDLLIRGKTAHAIAKLSDYESKLERALDSFHKEPPDVLQTFRREVGGAGAHLKGESIRLAEELKKQRGSAGTPAYRQLEMQFAQVRTQYEAMWKEQFVRNLVNNFGSDWAMPELREHLTYFMGLAKLEMAIAAERRWRKDNGASWPKDLPTPSMQFTSALEWFNRYEALVLSRPDSEWLQAVKERKALCQQKLKEFAQLTARQ